MLKKLSKKSGFTLIELAIAMIVVGIIANIAYPTYLKYVRKAHRADGTTTLFAMQMAQEKYRYGNTTYGTLAQVWNSVSTSPNGYYTMSISGNTATGYTLTASANGNQASDAENGVTCTPLRIVVNGSTVTKSPTACW